MTSLRRLMFAKAASGGSGGGWRTATGAVASFIATRSTALPMEFDLLPIQDLHGQANPYPPGGGKNLLNNTANTNTKDGVTFTINTDGSVTVSGTATATIALFLGTLSVRQGETYTISGSISAYNSNQAQLFCNSNSAFPVGNRLQSYSGRSITATALADETITVRLYVYNGTSVTGTFYPQIEYGSTATAYSPYSNICPITGHDGFTTIGTDAILYDYQNDPPVQGTINGTTGKAASNLYRIRTPYIKVKPNTAYTIRTNLPYAYVHEFMSNNENSYIGNLGEWFEPPFSFTTTATTQYIRLVLAFISSGSAIKVTPSDLEYCNVLENAVSTIRQTTFDTPPGTVYGAHVRDNGDGTYDLTVDRKYDEYNGSAGESWLGTTDNLIQLYALKLGNKGLVVNDECISNEFKNEPGISVSNGIVGFRVLNSGGYNDARIVVRPPWAEVGSTVQQLKTWLASNPLQVVYKLSNPTVYTGLPLTTLQSLIGQNHVWVDNADSVSVEYWGH